MCFHEWPANVPGPRPTDCSGLSLEYQDLGAIGEGWLRLHVVPTACRASTGTGTGTRGTAVAVEGTRFEAGGFAGAIREGNTDTYGTISDGVTEVDFSIDLSPAELAPVLAGLAPLDLGRDL